MDAVAPAGAPGGVGLNVALAANVGQSSPGGPTIAAALSRLGWRRASEGQAVDVLAEAAQQLLLRAIVGLPQGLQQIQRRPQSRGLDSR